MKIVTAVSLCAIWGLFSACHLPIEHELLAEEATVYRTDPLWAGSTPSVVPFVERTVGEDRVAARLTILHSDDGPVYVARVHLTSSLLRAAEKPQVLLQDGEGIEWTPVSSEGGEEMPQDSSDPQVVAGTSAASVSIFPAPRPMPLILIVRLHDGDVRFATDHQFR